MSLVAFISLPDVAARLRPFRPPVRPASVRLLVPPRFPNRALTGTAFDYLLRFELQRRAPHARGGAWVAEHGPRLVFHPGGSPGAGAGRDYLFGRCDAMDVPPKVLGSRIAAVCLAARDALAEFAAVPAPAPSAVRAMAEWAVRLAKIDGVYRRGELDPTFEQADPRLVDELVALLAAVPFRRFVHPAAVLLNPEFGAASAAVGGADADLIVGDTLIDLKTTGSSDVRGEALDQLFGYFLLARRAGLPPIRQVAVYLSRYGRLRTGETAAWTSHPDFADTEAWFFERAELYRRTGL